MSKETIHQAVLSGELPHKPSANSSNGKKTKQKKSSRIWKKKDLAIEDCSWKVKLSEPPEDVLSPFECFSMFFDNEMIDALHYQTNLYSTQRNGNCISVTHEEMRKYLSILVISGIVRMPHFRMFWHSGTRFAPVADVMSNRFEAIHQCLYMNDNLQALPQGTDGYDRLFKVRPLLDELRKNMSKVAPDERQSIDEQIIPFKGRSHLKQYLKSKPHKWGYKVFTRESFSGMMHDFIIYEGKGTASDNGFGISGDIVIDLVKTLPQHVNQKLFFDNWFTSLRLVDELKIKGFHCIGTVRADRTEKCPLSSDAALKAQEKEAPWTSK
ncbi:piggyBac transposable element-derived protein 3-like [Ixodes scapularis]|uniref:piggyBac transposable element-derived protein 3-like n=1 Tax=Ixodes scapularis TaxID=6945 RepID=UPI001A9F7716|nr:piggyBac transposable element-derived protein 3-like [Ixodes scapularis]